MKIENLFESSQHQDFAYGLLNKFRSLAREVHLGLGSEMSWPRVSKKKVIYGMTFSELTKSKAAKNEPLEDRLPIEIRVKSILIKIAKELVTLMQAGHSVFVYDKNRYQNSEGIQATEDNIQELLKKHLQMDASFANGIEPGPTVLFSVSTPAVENKQELYAVKFGMHYEYPPKSANYLAKEGQVYTFVPEGDEEFAKLFGKIKSEYLHVHFPPNSANGVESRDSAQLKLRLIVEKIIHLMKATGIKFPKFDPSSRVLIAKFGATKPKMYKRYGVRMERDEFIEKIIKPLLDS